MEAGVADPPVGVGEDVDDDFFDPEAADESVLGDEAQLQFEELVGGKAPTIKKVRLYGGGVNAPEPEGGWKKGERYVVTIEVVCHKASYTDELDGKTSEVVGCSDERGLKIAGVRSVKRA